MTLLPLLLASCQAPAPGPSASPTATLPTQATPAPAPAAPVPAPINATRYRIRSDLSDVRFLVYRAGPLARLGHNHVIQAGIIQGEIQLARNFKASTVRLTLPVTGFQVDNASARREEGEDFATEPDENDIAGTRRNMLSDKVLDAARYPDITIASATITGPSWQPDITLRIKLHGEEKEATVPVALEFDANKLIATAAFSVRQSDFGITPLAVLGGGLQVADTVRIRLRLGATKE
ncbi:MAG TPA: YceI family protein [Rhodocyclaceae bacterium]|nr:YceI family protein [Rhodocyclaceae bacterium]